VKLVFNGRNGKVGSVLAPALEGRGHELVDSLDGADAMVDFTRPESVLGNIRAAIAAGVPAVVGTSGWDTEAVRDADVAVFYAPNFALGAVLMMRFAEQAAAYFPRAEIIELHHETKLDAPSGTARATAERLGGSVSIHSVRLPGLVAHQEVLFGGIGEVLTIRHDTTSREAFTAGVLLALERLPALPAGLTVGLDALL
jgi:4-hydroxy-tetrahydrodipicolinate reductase